MARERTSYDIPVQEKAPFDQSMLAQGGPDNEVVLDRQLAELNKLGEDLGFMSEMVTIRFLGMRDPNDARLAEIGVTINVPSGDGKMLAKSAKFGFERGKTYTVRRYVVEAAAHAKREALEQYSDPRDPYRILQRVTPSLAYPFEILRDTDKGRAYLEARINDPA